jgi:hypothetical protein
MEFIPGVMFIKDKNNNIDSDNIVDRNIFYDDTQYMNLDASKR